MDDKERQEEFCKLKQLYAENLEFLNLFATAEEASTLAYKQFKETLSLLKQYILELENGAEITTNWKEWCNRLAQVLDKFYDEINPNDDDYRDSDSFNWIDEEGFSDR